VNHQTLPQHSFLIPVGGKITVMIQTIEGAKREVTLTVGTVTRLRLNEVRDGDDIVGYGVDMRGHASHVEVADRFAGEQWPPYDH
jgi:hypothetical protein